VVVGWLPSAEHVVPLEDLVEDDPVGEATETDAEQDAGSAGPPRCVSGSSN
jgi:hypothetical protein